MYPRGREAGWGRGRSPRLEQVVLHRERPSPLRRAMRTPKLTVLCGSRDTVAGEDGGALAPGPGRGRSQCGRRPLLCPGQTRWPLTATSRAAPGLALRPGSRRPRGSPGSWPHLLASRASGQRGRSGGARVIIMQGAHSEGSNSSHLLIPES